jgi:hypothetical protein
MTREEKEATACLLDPAVVKVMDPNGPVLTCPRCPNRSDTIGDLGKTCANRK